MNKINTIAIGTLLSIGATTIIGTPASAVTINLGGSSYEVTTIEGSFDDNQTLLEDQPWWTGGSNSLANDAAGQVDNQLGLPNNSNSWGPYFAYSFSGGTVMFSAFNGSSVDGNADIGSSASRTYAVVNEVPEPMTILGTLLAGSIGIVMNKKTKTVN